MKQMERKKIIALAWPAILEMLLYMLLDIVDVAFVGRLGPRALAAVGLGAQIYFSVLFVFSAIAAGATALIARAIGAGEKQKAGRVAGQALLLALMIGAGFGLVAFFFAQEIVGLFRFEEEVRQLAAVYLRTAGTPAAFALLLFVASGIFRGAGLTKIPLVIAGITNIVHIGADYVFIFGKLGLPALGVQGAALATAFAQTFGCFLAILLLLTGLTPLRVSPDDFFRLEFGLIGKVVNLSVPAGLEEALISFGAIASSYLLAALGTLAFAAHQVTLVAESLSYMPGYGFAVAATTLVGQSLGAGRPEDACRHAWEAVKLALLVMGGVALIFLFVPELVVQLFASDPEVIGLSALCLRIAAFEQPGIAIDMVLAGALRGAGDTRTPMLITVFSTWFLRLPLFYLAVDVYSFGLPVIWVITVGDWLVRAMLVASCFKRGNWRKIQL
ncbi:MAG TPA: MATE family efflux transporter [Peptococcaceae bacterium]|nr:MATE family efflux transporter [Peptococcaceae bacterium]